MSGRRLSVKTGMDGPQEGNSMQGRKEGGAVLPLSNSQRALAIPDRPTKMESDCPHSATHKRCPHWSSPRLQYKDLLWTRLRTFYFARAARDLVTLISVVLNPFKEIFTLGKLGLCNTDYDCTWAGMRTSVRRSGPRPAGEI